MRDDIINFLDDKNSNVYGRVRTLSFIGEHCSELCGDLDLHLELLPVSVITPESGWEFIKNNKLNRIQDLTDDQQILHEFLRYPLQESIRANLKKFLMNRLVGPLIIDASFKGEDMGITLPSSLFPSIYIVDSGHDFTERLKRVEDGLKTIWARVFFQDTKKYYKNLALPFEDWMVSIVVTEPAAPRRGTFYYPDISAVVKTDGKTNSGCIIPGWWEPSRVKDTIPVRFVPGSGISEGPDTLLALEGRSGKGVLTEISRHLARTHGTMNLPVRKKGEENSSAEVYSSLDKSQCVVWGDESRFSQMVHTFINRAYKLLGEPVIAHFHVQPNATTGEMSVFLSNFRTWIPPSPSTTLPMPSRDNVHYLFKTSSNLHTGAISKYFIQVSDNANRASLKRLLDQIEFEGEGVILEISSTDILDELGNPGSISGLISKDPALKKYSHNFIHVDDINLKKLVHHEKGSGYEVYVCPASIKLSSNGSEARAWI
ncbi:MAG: hypothetical protein JXR95_01075 [Deltaproteobacteria bacterium]|nr:hypothetical protein [Deltaproteobacteria bacterium]